LENTIFAGKFYKFMLGRLHPLIVHLPIGMLLLAIAMSWLSLSRRRALQSGLNIVWGLAAAGTIAACGSGWLLAHSGAAYETAVLYRHQWLNIGLAVTTLLIALGYFSGLIGPRSGVKLSLLPLIPLYMGTMSGTALTHGEHFLKGAAPEWQESHENIAAVDVPSHEAPPPNGPAIEALRQKGVVVMPVAKSSNWLSLNCVNYPGFSDADLSLLLPLAPNIVWLRMSGTQVGDAVFPVLQQMPNLSRVFLDGTLIMGSQMGALTQLSRLTYLNLSNTQLQPNNLSLLSGCANLKQVFLRQTAVSGQNLPFLGTIQVDTGGYRMEFLTTDTARLKAQKSY
jgi:uncharacterized membrane protein